VAGDGSRGTGDLRSPVASDVRRLSDALRAVSEAAATGSALAEAPDLPDDETLRPITDAVRALLGVLGTGMRLTVLGRAWSGWL
jgi:hypothetical protein